jgi:hypothetical protein
MKYSKWQLEATATPPLPFYPSAHDAESKMDEGDIGTPVRTPLRGRV